MADPSARRRPVRRSTWPWVLVATVAALALLLRFGNTVAIVLEDPRPSVSIGTPSNGSLERGKRLPSRGVNFRAYSDLGALLGRNAVDGRVRSAVLQAYGDLARSRPGTLFLYGETGWPSGGRFRPHRTHQNGMAVDFLVPVRDQHGRSRWLPAHAFNHYGYDIEFSADGRWRDYRIDYPAMAAHLRALDAASRRHGLKIRTVIFDPALLPQLLSAAGNSLARDVAFSRRDAWVRHDEHYHVVFEPAHSG